jgi:hypothetical protein
MPKTRRGWLFVFLVAASFGAIASWAGLLFFGSRKPLDHTKLTSYTVEKLIDALQDEASEGLGTYSTAWADGFLASDKEAKFRGGILGSAKPNVSPVMRELVRRGVAALPNLMVHLEDRRLSCLVIQLPFGGFGGMWHSDEYEPRYSDKEKQPPDVNQDRGAMERGIAGEYKVRVGDLCFVIIGQIVNRRMSVVRYQPSGCIVINSPVETPALAQAVKADWAGLTAQQHEASLIEDSKDSSEYGVAAALARLRFYYPESAARQDLKAP